jgi:hypothetical protein
MSDYLFGIFVLYGAAIWFEIYILIKARKSGSKLDWPQIIFWTLTVWGVIYGLASQGYEARFGVNFPAWPLYVLGAPLMLALGWCAVVLFILFWPGVFWHEVWGLWTIPICFGWLMFQIYLLGVVTRAYEKYKLHRSDMALLIMAALVIGALLGIVTGAGFERQSPAVAEVKQAVTDWLSVPHCNARIDFEFISEPKPLTDLGHVHIATVKPLSVYLAPETSSSLIVL